MVAGSAPPIDLIRRAVAAAQRGAWDEASALAETVLRTHGPEANALMVLGSVCSEAGDISGAIAHLERARAIMPAHIHVLVNLASAYRTVGRPDDARATLEAALKIDAGFAIAHNNLGNVHLDAGDRTGAKACYEQAAKLDASYADPVAGLARIAEEEHRLDEALRLADRALRIAPGNAPATLAKARVGLRRDQHAACAAALEKLLSDRRLSATNRAIAEGLLGECYDGLGRFDEAFAAFSRANDLQLQQNAEVFGTYRGPMSPATVAELRSFVASADAAQWSAAPATQEMPVFLVGFPRSGTTLLDQILASHPQITTLEEYNTLIDASASLIMRDGAFDTWATLPAAEIERLRALYWRQVQAGLGDAGASRREVFVDKLPLNSVLLPLIFRLFPAAKIVLALRDPRDVVWSCFQQRFKMNPAMFQLLRLESAAAYYHSIMDLVRASRDKFPLNVHEVRYEGVIANYETEVRALLAFIGVPWNEAVRDHTETAKARVVRTPSAPQVVRPIYASAQGKWRKYRRFLEPYLPALEPWVAAFGYDAS